MKNVQPMDVKANGHYNAVVPVLPMAKLEQRRYNKAGAVRETGKWGNAI